MLSLILSEVYYREKVDESSVQICGRDHGHSLHGENLTCSPPGGDIGRSPPVPRHLTPYSRTRPTFSGEFFIHLKMQEACRCLPKNTNLYIYEASSRPGYEDQYYFSGYSKSGGRVAEDYKNGIIFTAVGELVNLERTPARWMGDFSDAAAPI